MAEIEILSDAAPFQIGDVTVDAMRNIHPPITDTYALRFSHAGQRVVISGDTAFMPEMIEFARDADILVHEAMLEDGVEALVTRMTNGDDRLRTHILRSHTSAENVGRIAQEAGVKQLALTHMVPDGDPDFTDAHWVQEIRKQYNGRFQIGTDGLTLRI